MNTRTALQLMAAHAFPDEERLRQLVPEAERARSLHQILDNSRLHPVPDPAPRGRRWAPVFVVGVVVAAVLAAVAVFALPGPVGDPPLTGPAGQVSSAPVAPDLVPPAPVTTDPAPATDLANTLPELADRAAAQPVADKPFDYVHLRITSPTVVTDQDGSVTQEEDSVMDRERWTSDKTSERYVDTVRNESTDWSALGGNGRVDLPTDPDALQSVLLSRPGNTLREPSLYFAMESVWSYQVVEGPVQATFLQLLASRKDVHVVGPTTDRLGRPGLEVSVTESGEVRGDPVKARRTVFEHRMIFDQRTGALLAFELVVLEGGEYAGPRPLTWTYAMVVEATRLDAISERH
jgi:hypothetical protein